MDVAAPTCTATLQERLEPLAGDELVRDAVVCSTHAICVSAPREHVWPWLAQMGARRAGWYSLDWLDNDGRRSLDEIRPELQRLKVGDVLPALPTSPDGFVVQEVDPPRKLVLAWRAADGSCIASWAFLLRTSALGDRTRLLVRARLSRLAMRPSPGAARPAALVDRICRAVPHLPLPIVRAMAALGHGLMQSTQLRGIKRRAESSARA